MLRGSTLTYAVTLLALAVLSAGAQSPACGSRVTMIASAGLGQSDRVDAAISPSQFQGRGADVSIGIDYSWRSLCLVAGARGGSKSLAVTSGSAGRERSADADAAFGVLRPLVTHSRSGVFALGLEMRGSATVIDHAYADPRQSVSRFRLSIVSLGPAVRWVARAGRGTAVVQMSAPALSIVDHPYTPLWSGNGEPRFRVASPRDLTGGMANVSYALPLRGDVSIVGTYRVGGMNYRDVQRVRTLTQVLTLGLGRSIR